MFRFVGPYFYRKITLYHSQVDIVHIVHPIFKELGSKLVGTGAGKLHDKLQAISSQHRQVSQYSAVRPQKRPGEALSTNCSVTTADILPVFHSRQQQADQHTE